MARSFPDRSVVAALLLSAGALSSVLAATPQLDKKTPIDFKEGKGCFSGNLGTGTIKLCDVTLTQGTNTRITADHASAKGLSDDKNGEWLLTDKVHIEFDNVILDADSATVVFEDNQLRTVHVKGAPSRFSQQLKDAARRNQGRAATIDYDSQKGVLQLMGDTWFSDGRIVFETAALTYNLNDGSFSSSEGVNGSLQPNKRVPPPRTPDRATSQ